MKSGLKGTRLFSYVDQNICTWVSASFYSLQPNKTVNWEQEGREKQGLHFPMCFYNI